jgi:hypothetical protein
MDNQFMLLAVTLLNQSAALAIRECNEYTSRFGLMLSEQEIGQLIEHRKLTLERYGRIEFGKGILQKIIMEFADSAYMNQQDYMDTLMQLQECFYYFKGEGMEELSDDDLIKIMKLYFEDICQGSVELLQSTMLENYCRDIRYGAKYYQDFNGYEDDYTDFLDWDEREW